MSDISKTACQFGARIRYLRTLKNLTQAHLAEQCDLSIRQIGRIERGESSPSFSVLEKLCQSLGTNLLSLFLFLDEKINADCLSQQKSNTSQQFRPAKFAESHIPSGMIGTWFMASEKRQETWTASIYELLGYRPFSVKPSQKRFLKHVHPAVREECCSFFDNTRQGSERSKFLVALTSKNDCERIVLIHADRVEREPTGEADVDLIIHDVTEWMALSRTLVSNQEELEEHVLARNKELAQALEKFELEAAQRKEAEQNLRICKQMVESSLDAQAFVDANGIIVNVNRAYERLVEGSAGQLVGRRYEEVLAERWGQDFFNHVVKPRLDKALRHGLQTDYREWFDYGRQGSRYIHVFYTPNRRDREILGIVVTIHDLTEYKSVQERLEASEARYRSVVDTANEGIVMVDGEQCITFANKKINNLLGYQAEELLGLYALNILHPEEIGHIHSRIAQSHAGQNIRYTTRLIHKNGQTIWVVISAASLHDVQGRFQGALLMLMDVTALKETEAALESKARKLDAFFNASQDLMSICDLNGSIIRVNQAWERVLGHPQEEYLDKGYHRFIHPEDLPFTRNAVHDLPKVGMVDSFVDRYRTRNGEYRTIEWQGQSTGNMICAVGRDVTQRKQDEQMLFRQNELQRMMMHSAIGLINIPMEEMDTAIGKLLKLIGEYSGSDRTYLFVYDWDRGLAHNTHEWTAKGISPQIENLQNCPVDLLPEWINAHKHGEVVSVPDVHGLPRASAARYIYESQDIRSLLTIPLMHAGECLGFVGFDAVREQRTWSDMDVFLLKISAELLANTEMRRRNEARR